MTFYKSHIDIGYSLRLLPSRSLKKKGMINDIHVHLKLKFQFHQRKLFESYMPIKTLPIYLSLYKILIQQLYVRLWKNCSYLSMAPNSLQSMYAVGFKKVDLCYKYYVLQYISLVCY